MKYAVNDKIVIDTDRISWKSILSPYNPLPYKFGSVRNTKNANNKHDVLENPCQ